MAGRRGRAARRDGYVANPRRYPAAQAGCATSRRRCPAAQAGRTKSPRGAGADQRGFTLIEVLVAVALMAIVSVMSWRGLDSVIRARDHVAGEAQRDDALLRVLGQLATDVRMRAPDAVVTGGTAAHTDGAAARADSAAEVLPPALRLDGEGGLMYLDIVRGPAEAGAWHRVRWWRDGSVLRRAVAPASDAFPLPEPVAQAGAAVLDGVSDFAMQAWIPGQGWTPLPAPPSAPAATGLAFVVQTGEAGATQTYRRVVALP